MADNQGLFVKNHSGTIETLIEENDDLRARFTVNLRKNAQLEQELQEQRCMYGELLSKVESLSDQILIHREKDVTLKSRNNVLEDKYEKLQSEVQLQRIRYAELYSTSQTEKRENEEAVKQLKKSAHYLKRFQKWTREALYPAYRQQKDELGQLKNALKDLHQTLGESGNYIKNQKEEFERSKDGYENRISLMQKDLSTLDELKEKCQRLKEEQTVHQNRVVSAERLRDEIQEKYKKETERFQNSLSEVRSQVKKLEMDNLSFAERQRLIEDEQKETLEQNDQLRDQNESLQLLWTESRKRIEEMESKEEAMQKLNQKLSSKLTDLRKEMESQQAELARNKEQSEKELRLLKTQMDLDPNAKRDDQSLSPDLIGRLEELISEAKGQTATKPAIKGQLADYEIESSDKTLMSEEGDLSL